MNQPAAVTPQPTPPTTRKIQHMVDLTRYSVTTYNVRVVAEPTAPRRFQKHRSTLINSAEAAYHFVNALFDQIPLDRDREHALLLTLNIKNKFEGFKVVHTGSLTSSLVNLREVFHAAIVLRAAAVIFVHNHPSGDPAPSPEDIDMTKRLKQAADVMNIRFLDHVILGHDCFYSFSDKGKV